MATSVYLSQAARITRGRNDAAKSGSNVPWRSLGVSPTVGSGSLATTASISTDPGPTSGIEFGSPKFEWISDLLAADVTISGTVTFDMYAYESSMSANATVAVIVTRLDKTGAVVSTIVDSSFGTELGTSNALKTWTATPTSTNMLKGERLRIVVYIDDATAVTMAVGYTAYVAYAGTVAGEGASRVQFNETFSFMAPTLQNYYWGYRSQRYGLAYGAGRWVYTGGVISGETGYTAHGEDAGWFSGPTSNTQNALCFGGSLFVSAGNNGSIWTSTDGITFTNRTTPDSTTALYGVSYGSSLYVAVGASGKVWTSVNGTTGWTNRTTPSAAQNCSCVAYGDGIYLVGLIGGGLWSSSDGTTWNAETSGTSEHIGELAYSSTLDLWVAACANKVIRTSSNGTSWSGATVPTDASATTCYSVIWLSSAGLFVICTNSAQYCWVSSNGTDWSVAPIPQWLAEQVGTWAYNSDLDLLGGLPSTGYYFKVIKPSALSAQVLYPTSVASNIVDQGTTELKAWTTRGTG